MKKKKRSTRLLLAACVLIVGAISSVAMSQVVNNKICRVGISCADRLAPCRCPLFTLTCTVCTGSSLGNFCFDCPGSNCIAHSFQACGQEWKGVCLSPCVTCPLVCVAQTLVGNCVALRC